MPNPRLLAVVTALMLSAGTPAAHASYTLTDLQRIEQLILDREWNELRAYIASKPDLARGDDPLASELRTFLETSRDGFLAQIFNPPQAPDTGLLDQLVAQY